MERIPKYAAIVSVCGGLILGIPPLYSFFASLGVPWIAMLVGWITIILFLMWYFER